MLGLRGRSAAVQRRGGASSAAAVDVVRVACSKPSPIGCSGSSSGAAAAHVQPVPRAVAGLQRSSQPQRRQLAPALQAAGPATDAPAKAGCPRGTHWQVHKFGGTCMATADRIRDVAQLVLDDPADSKVVVVSAMGSHPTSPVKVTDLLLNMIKRASQQDNAFLLDLAQLQEKHLDAAKQLLGTSAELNEFVAGLIDDIANLKAMLQAMSIAGMSSDAFADYVVGHGELWSAKLLTLKIRQMGHEVEFLDTRDALVVTPTSDGTSVDLQEDTSNKKLDTWFNAKPRSPKLVVATGFIAKNPQGQATTLKRNGSDFSATIMGALFRAGYITIWTDVDGVFSADPRKVPEAVCLPGMTYHEAWEMSYFGANVLHPRTTLPAMKYKIPVAIRNFFNLKAPGTVVSDVATDRELYKGKDVTVKGFATIDNVVLINVEGTGMVGVPGIASAIFSTVRDANINVIMISQASSEQSICFAVRREDGDLAVKVLEDRFAQAISAGRVSAVQKIQGCCVLAAVGQGMVNRKGSAATMMSALAGADINIKAIAQGSSEYNITVLIDQKDAERGLRAVHSRFYLSDTPIGVGLVGPGLIGSALLSQLRDQRRTLLKEFAIDIRVLGIADSKRMLLKASGVDLDNWKEDFEANSVPCDLKKFGDFLRDHYIPNSAIIDCTASDVPATNYLPWMHQGIHVITPNKKLGSGPLEQYQAVRKIQREGYIHFFYEGTVGAGLPVMATVKQLMETGDKITRVEGILSGTLSYIFNTFGDGRKFSEIVKEAKAKGFTEPDPRDDLNGTDVARKVCILAREAGLLVELSDIPVQSLVPEPLRAVAGGEEYMARLPEFDGEMETRLREAEATGEVLRYVGVVDVASGKGSVELRRYPKSHPFAQLSGTDNIISFTTQRYFKQSLVVRGPGAGAEVTAGGVFGDLLRLAAYLGAPS